VSCFACAGGDAWIKTCRTLSGEVVRCCDPCYEVLRSVLTIVPGEFVCWARCSSCGDWRNPREFSELKPGAAGRGDAPGGICGDCG
jgi:hypothetical protein